MAIQNSNQIYEFNAEITGEKYYSDQTNWGCFLFRTETALPNADPSKNYLLLDEDRPNAKQYYSSTLIGKVQRLTIGQEYKIKAKPEYSKKYGWNYSVITAESDLPKSVDDQKKFLLSICTEGQAESLLSVYPDIVEGTVSGKYDEKIDLSGVKGIKDYYWNLIRQRILDNYVMADLLAMLIPLGISYAKVKKLFDDEPNALLLKQKLMDDPYILVDIPGISFKTADKIATKLNPDLLVSKKRSTAFIKHYLRETGENEGHTYVTIDMLELAVKENIIECEELCKEVIEDEKAKEDSKDAFLHVEGEKVASKYYWFVEKELWTIIKKLNETPPLPITQEQIDKGIEKAEREQKFNFTDEQREAIIRMTQNSFSVVTGLGGTGKTTITRGLLNIYKEAGYSIAAVALSARAAKRIEEVTHFSASTIHRLLKSEGGNNFFYNKDNKLNISVLLVDECSMIYSGLFYHLMSAIEEGTKVIWSGDFGQLPPLSWGQAFGDILEKKNLQINYLTTIHRQAAKSGIISDSNKIRNGEDPLNGKKSFKTVSGELQDLIYMARNDRYEINNIAIKAYLKAVQDLGLENVQIVVPRKKDCINSTKEINKKIQDSLLDDEIPCIKFGDTKYKVGSRVLHTKNDYKRDVFNGDLGIINRLDANEDGEQVVVVEYPDKEVQYTRDELAYLELAYAMSCHKMQGGQCNTVIGIIDNTHYPLLDRTLLYTMLSRAEKRCLLLFEPYAYDRSVSFSKVDNRLTWLKEFN